MHPIEITFPDGSTQTHPVGIEVAQLPGARDKRDGLPCVAALVNNDVVSLSYSVSVRATVHLLTRADSHGWRVYRNSLAFLLAKALRDLFPNGTLTLEHSFGLGLYCSFRQPNHDGITEIQLETLRDHMRALVAQDVPITRRRLAFDDAVHEFEAAGDVDKLKLLQYRNPPYVVVHHCDDFTDLAHGPLAPGTGVLDQFELIHYAPGFVLHLPDRDAPHALAPFEDQPHLFNIYQEHKEWGRILDVNTVGRLNEIIFTGEIGDFIRTAEALHENKVSHIANDIATQRGRLKLILIAGPSSAGKTTFAKRLTTQLRVRGLRPLTISTDNYFVGPEDNPVDENGELDFEHLEAVDLPLFNRDLLKLIHGETVDLPTYNFAAKRREYRGDQLRLADDQMLIIEGIHGLNPRLTEMVPREAKYRVYISALTQLNIDSHNRISTTDNRLMRRMVRDNRYRGHSALVTLKLWPSVRRGEKRWIFPFQQEADATFNSALDYELAVLKPKVEPLLMQIKPSHTEYAEARRLSEFLLNFLATDDRPVYRTSILREYIGGSAFRY